MGVLYVLEDCPVETSSPKVQNISLIVEESVVLQDIADTPTAVAYLFGLLYALNISYPKHLKYTFDTLQSVFMEMGPKCTKRVRSLKNKLALWNTGKWGQGQFLYRPIVIWMYCSYWVAHVNNSLHLHVWLISMFCFFAQMQETLMAFLRISLGYLSSFLFCFLVYGAYSTIQYPRSLLPWPSLLFCSLATLMLMDSSNQMFKLPHIPRGLVTVAQ